MSIFAGKYEARSLLIRVLAAFKGSLADDAFAGESEKDLLADALPFESALAAVPLLDDGETVHVAVESRLDLSSVHRGVALFDARDEEIVRRSNGRLVVYPDFVSFLKLQSDISFILNPNPVYVPHLWSYRIP